MPRHSASALAVVEPESMTLTLSPERQALATAIETVADVERQIAETNEAISQDDDARLAAFNALDVAERALERAKPRESSIAPPPRPPSSFWSEEAVQAYAEEQATPPIPIAEARAAVERAKDDLDSVRRMSQFHKDQLDRLGNDLRWRLKRDQRRGSCRCAI